MIASTLSPRSSITRPVHLESVEDGAGHVKRMIRSRNAPCKYARIFIIRLVQEWHGREDELQTGLAEVVPSYIDGRQRADSTFFPRPQGIISNLPPRAFVPNS